MADHCRPQPAGRTSCNAYPHNLTGVEVSRRDDEPHAARTLPFLRLAQVQAFVLARLRYFVLLELSLAELPPLMSAGRGALVPRSPFTGTSLAMPPTDRHEFYR